MTDRPRVRFTSVPAGGAPFKVRKAWLGVEVPLAPGYGLEGTPEVPVDVVTMRLKYNAKPIVVDAIEAIDALAKKNPSAAQWWKNTIWYSPGAQLVFNRGECEPVQQQQ